LIDSKVLEQLIRVQVDAGCSRRVADRTDSALACLSSLRGG
jgi:hypothetical protein